MSETLSAGLTITIPSEGDENWATSLRDDCFAIISAHDHTGGGDGAQIATAAIVDEAVTINKLVTAVQQALVPTGSIIATGRSTAPSGYLLCDGDAVSRATYADLFAAIGTTYGVGDNSTTFNLPNLKQRFPIGKADSGTANTLGATGGAIDHTHTLPAHSHGLGTLATASSGAGTTGGMSANATLSHSVSDPQHSHGGTTGAGGTHDHQTFSMGGNHLRPYNGINDDALGGGTFGSNGAATRTSSDGNHTHSFTTNNAATGITIGNHDVSHTHTTPNHTHTLTGSVGNTGSGVSGDSAMTSGVANPPFQVVNYIIKI